MVSAIDRLARTTYTFVLLNWAAVAGLVQYLKGHDGFWNVANTRGTHRLRRV